jgi:integrase
MIGTVRFHLRLEKISKDFKAPIYIDYSIKNQRKSFSTGIKVYAQYWDKEAQKVFYIALKDAKRLIPELTNTQYLTEIEVKELNHDLESLLLNISKLEDDFIRNSKQFSSTDIAQLIQNDKSPVTRKEEPNNFIYDFIEEYIQNHKLTRVKGSLSVYKALSVHLKGYETTKRERVTFDGIDYRFFESFQNYLVGCTRQLKSGEVINKLNNQTIAKQLSTLKTILQYAKKNGIKVSESYKDFRIIRHSLEVIALTFEEFKTLYNYDLSSKKTLDKVRDIFCFSCTTGLRYSDMAQLKWEHIKNDEIILTVQKTKERLTIPLNEYSSAILKKYQNHFKPLAMISAQNLNLYLKELGELVGIDEKTEKVRFYGSERRETVSPKFEMLTIHVGRKTFVTLSLELGMSTELVMSISGHKDYKSFSRYVHTTNERKRNSMTKHWGEPSNLKIVS